MASVPHIDLDAVLAHMPTPLVVLRIGDGEVVYANAAARKLAFAYERTDGVHVLDVDGRPIADGAHPYDEATRGASFDGRLARYRIGDDEHALRFHCHSLGDGLCVLTFDDVTSLHQTQHELREAVQSRDELVSMTAHELRSPLGALQLIAERLCRKANDMGTHAGEVRQVASMALRQTRRLGVLLGNLLDATRIRAGRFELDREETSLAEIIQDACEPLIEHAEIAAGSFFLRIEDPGDGAWDRVRMEQVVINLVQNASKYGAPPIEIWLRRVDGVVALTIADAGPGIAAEEQPRIFEPFRRANRKHSAHSLGLGLFIVHQIVTAHGGTIELRSAPGRTVFTILLPSEPRS